METSEKDPKVDVAVQDTNDTYKGRSTLVPKELKIKARWRKQTTEINLVIENKQLK